MIVLKKALPRRTVLRGLGASIALPLLDGMVPAFAAIRNSAAAPTPRLSILYTGNGSVAKIVMAAAAKHLTPVTLELGGKSPCIVDGTADIPVTARRIAWGKFMNAGQTCIAPDYLYVHADVADAFVEAMGKALKRLYGDQQAMASNTDYCRIVNDRHHGRVKALIDDATERGLLYSSAGATSRRAG